MARILIVDDSKTSRKILRGILEEYGHEIIAEAENGEDGFKKFKETQPEITTMDITMPIMDGLEALRHIKSYRNDAKIIMVTAAGQKTKMIDAIRLGAAEFLAKPYEAEQVIELINKVI
jgi:two-component system chemotaxis response regulator CheY